MEQGSKLVMTDIDGVPCPAKENWSSRFDVRKIEYQGKLPDSDESGMTHWASSELWWKTVGSV